jgi:MHS family shikimate/dehydroshikimate transporter-like MFS transporter
MDGASPVAVGAVITVMMLGAHATAYGVVSSVIAEQFHTRVRYSGTALSNALGALIFSAPTPLIAEAVVGDGSRWWPLALLAIGASAVSLIAIAGTTRGTTVPGTPAPQTEEKHVHVH